MAHGGHFAERGNSAKRFMSGADVGLAPEVASFVAAHCSPFVDPIQLDVAPRVPDTKAHIQTAYAYLNADFQIPVRNIEDSGEQVIIMNANPLAALPIVYASHPWDQFGNSTPNEWAKQYQDDYLGALMSKTKQLGEISKKHRVVGAAIRVNASRSTTISRGTMRGGQIEVADTYQITNDPIAGSPYLKYSVPVAETSSVTQTSINPANGYEQGTRTYPQDAGYLGQALMDCTVQNIRDCIRNARENESVTMGDQGMSVRWSPSDEFKFIKTVNHNVVHPSRTFYPNGIPTSFTSNASASGTYADVAGNSTDYMSGTRWMKLAGQTTTSFLPKNRVFYYEPATYDANAMNIDGYDICAHYADTQIWRQVYNNATPPVLTSEFRSTQVAVKPTELVTLRNSFDTRFDGTSANALVDLTAQTADFIFYAADVEHFKNGLIHLGHKDMHYKDPDQNFEKALYIDVTGLDPNQVLEVSVVWHIEFIPKDFYLNPGRPSPVTLDWEDLKAMITNPQAFPIVVQGNSFFSSLWRGLKKAGRFGTRVANIAGPILSSLPDPRAQAAGAAISTGGEVGSMLFG